MCVGEHGHRVAAGKDEGADASGLEGILLLRASGETDVRCARGLERLGDINGSAFIHGVRRTQACELRARSLDGRDYLVAALEFVAGDCLDAADFEEILGE